MAYLAETDVQTWLEQTKLDIASVDTGLEAVAASKVLAALSEVYDTSSWLDALSTPLLVRQVMAMFVAAWTYRRQYSEDTDSVPTYADWLEGLANQLLADIANGTVVLVGVDPIAEGLDSGPDFYPKDYNYDTNGYRVDDAAFTMSQEF